MPKNRGLKIENGHDVVDYASEQGANISQRKDGRVKISTEKGSMLVYDNKVQYSSVDKGNVKRWLKLLGLLVLVAIPLCLWMNYVASLRAAGM